ncbi:MAG: NAD(P)H-binding protein [Burkholderiales bacterium]|nr:NAD(P)H-binding protein [Burkholderiales bacterium]
MRLLLLGATGAVGREVLAAALADPRIAQLIAPTRRPLPPHPKLLNPVIDSAALPADAPWWQVDAVICALGSTIKIAGSQAAFAAVDRDLPIEVGRLARAAGASRYALTSALGSSPRGNFYLRTKAEAEAGIRALGYPVYTVVRPSLIEAEREQKRPGEQIGLRVARVLGPLIPRRYRPVPAARIAQALLAGVLRVQPGEQVVESEALQP